MMNYKLYSSFAFPHISSSFLKSTYEEVWEKENELLDKVSKNKFRTKEDVNQYIFKAWQYCKGLFYPRNYKFGDNIPVSNDNRFLINKILGKDYKVICLNDSEKLNDFEKVKNEINSAFESKFPNKSSFEK